MPLKHATSRVRKALRKVFQEQPQVPVNATAEAPHQLLAAVEESEDVIFVTEPDGCLTYVNTAFEKMYGLLRDEAIGNQIEIIKDGRVKQYNHKTLWEKTLASGHPNRDEYLNKANDGRLLRVVSTVYPVVDREGQVRSLVSVQRDVSDRHQLERLKKAFNSIVDEWVAESIAKGRLQTEKRRISLLNARFRNLGHGIHQRRPEMLVKDLNLLFQEIEPILLDYHAHVDKYLGDQIIAQFGIPVDYERHALLAVMAGIKIQERLLANALPWEMVIGVASGECMVGMIGQRRQSYTAVGAPVHLVSSILQSCTPGIVTVGRSTFEQVSQFVEDRRRTVFTFRKTDEPRFIARLWGLLQALDHSSDDVGLLKEAGLLFMEGRYYVAAHEHLQKAMELDPKDEGIKLGFAEASLKLKRTKSASLEPGATYLHEVLGMRDVLTDTERIPARLYQDFHREVERVVEYPEELILPVEALDGSLGHARTVGFLSYVLADFLGWGEPEKAQILEAGYLADLGKSTIDHHILNRPGNLNEREFKEIIKHPDATVKLLEQRGYRNQEVLRLIRSSHERMNGAGYPESLVGDKIPLGARILGVADTYAGLTAWRPYRNRWESRAACAEIRREAERGKFDPAVVEAFEQLIQ